MQMPPFWKTTTAKSHTIYKAALKTKTNWRKSTAPLTSSLLDKNPFSFVLTFSFALLITEFDLTNKIFHVSVFTQYLLNFCRLGLDSPVSSLSFQ
jgi:hypothetical protein